MGVVIRDGQPVPQGGRQQVSVNRYWVNVDQELLEVTVDRLELCLTRHMAEIRRSREWIAPLGIMVTVLGTLVGSTFRDNVLTADQWQGLFLLLLVLSIIWLGRAVRAASKTQVTPKSIVRELTQGKTDSLPAKFSQRGNLSIHWARYGAGSQWADVAPLLQSRIQDGRLAVKVSNVELGGDPAPNVLKNLELTYSYKGRSYSKTVAEHDELRLLE